MANFKKIRRQAIQKMTPVVEFFVGSFDDFKKVYRVLKDNRKANVDHPLMRPWLYEAFLAHAQGHRMLRQSKMRNVALCQQTIYVLQM